MVAAMFGGAWQSVIIVGLLLFLPLLDQYWNSIQSPVEHWFSLEFWIILAMLAALMLSSPALFMVTASTFLWAAFPEEWYFRRYLFSIFGFSFIVVIASSFFFALLHGLLWGWGVGLAVFLPSVIFGWTYQKTRDLGAVVVLHVLSNVAYTRFGLGRYLEPLL